MGTLGAMISICPGRRRDEHCNPPFSHPSPPAIELCIRPAGDRSASWHRTTPSYNHPHTPRRRRRLQTPLLRSGCGAGSGHGFAFWIRALLRRVSNNTLIISEIRGWEELKITLAEIFDVPPVLWTIGAQLEPRFGQLGREHGQIVFDKQFLERDPTLEWVTPGHPLFDSVREEVRVKTGEDIQRGAIFYDIHRTAPARLDVFSVAIKDGRGNLIHHRIFVVEAAQDSQLSIWQPTLILDLVAGEGGAFIPDDTTLPGDGQVK
jgi:hypothetical protein